MDIESIKKHARQFIFLKDEINVLTTRQTELKSRMMTQLDEVEPDTSGHRVLEFKDDTLGDVKLTKQRKVSKTLDMQVADDILTRKGIRGACIKTVEVLDEAAIMSAFYEGHLTEEEIDAMFPAKESYAFLVSR